MANTVNILGFANTFGDWIVATNADSNEINSIGKYDWTKDSGTLTLNGTGTSLSVGNNAVVQGQLQVTGTGSSATIDNNLTVGKQVYLTNTSQSLTASGTVTANGTVYASNTGTGLAVANNTTIGGTLTVGGATTISNTANITGAANISNSLVVSGPTTLGNTLSVYSNTYTSYLTTNNRTTTSLLTSTGAADFGTTVDVGTSVTIAGINVIPYITSSYTHANAAYSAQNTTGVYANTAYIQANSAYVAQNTTGVYANSAYIQANSAYVSQNTTGVYANAAYASQNTTGLYANSAYVQANAAYSAQNTTGVYANSAYAAQNVTGGYANSAYIQANSAYVSQNTTGVYANAAFLFANNLQSGAQTFNNMTLTGSSLSATNAVGAFQSLTTTGGLTVGGSFTINGTTIYTSNNFVINANTYTPISSYFSVNRGTANNQPTGIPNANASIRWNETGKYWDVLDVINGTQYSQIMTANMISDVTTSTSITTVPTSKILTASYAQANAAFALANTTSNTATAGSSYANSAFITANNALANTGVSVTSNSLTVYTFSNTTASTSNTTGSIVISGGLGVRGNVYSGMHVIAGSGNGITFTDGSLQTTAGLANTGTSVTANSLTVYTFANNTSTTSNTTGSVNITGGLAVRGNVYTGNVVITGSGNGIVFVDGTVQTTAGSPAASVYANAAFVAANTASSNAASASSYANSAYTLANTASNNATSAGSYANSGFTLANTASNTATSAGSYANSAFVKANNALANTGVSVTSNSLTTYTFSNTTASTSNTTGSIVLLGGLATVGNVYSGMHVITGSGNGITFTDGTIQTTAGSPAASVYANAAFVQANSANANAASSSSYANAAFIRANNSLNVQSGGTITGDLNLSGNLFVNGTTSYINVATFQTVDSLIELASNNVSDSVDIGFYGQYVSSGTKYTGLVRTAASNWTLFQGIGTNPTSNSVGTITYTNYATFKANIDAGQIVSSQPIGSASGGTGVASPTANSLLVANGTGAMKLVAPGTSGNVVMSDGTNWYSGAAAPAVSFSNDISTATPVYPLFSSATTGGATSLYTANARLLYTPSTGEFSSNTFIATNGMHLNSNTVAASYTIAAGNNGLSAGPMTVASGTVVTVSSGAIWTIV